MSTDITGRVSTVINAPATEVWEALTRPELIRKYFFGTETKTDWRVGSPVEFTGTWEGKTYRDKGKVTRYEPQQLLQYKYWSSMSGIEDNPENYVTITYELLDRGENTTTLTIIQENIPDEKMKEHSGQNWKKVLEDLKKLLEQGVETYA